MATMQPRRRFLSQALKYFLRQTYSPKELIVVDDPGESLFDGVRPAPEVRYLRTNSRLTLGSKLNLGIQEARGAIIQKLDDDDYYHPEFLSATVEALLARNQLNSIVAFTRHLVLIAVTGELKRRTGTGTIVFAPGTLCFFRELWQRGPFRDVSLSEHRFFLKDHEAARIGINNPELYCLVRHTGGHSYRHFVRSEQKDLGPVTAGEDVTEYLRKLPVYSKSLKEYIPAEDLWFYESQIEDPSHTSQPG
jgi:glycosyltransferase involved in cell wall biosynthesis